jgi:hypothetical protein
MKIYLGVGIKLHSFLILALNVERSASQPGRFISYESASDTQCAGGWIGPRCGSYWGNKNFFLLSGLEKKDLRTFLIFC